MTLEIPKKTPSEMSDDELQKLIDMTYQELHDWFMFRQQVLAEKERRVEKRKYKKV